MCPYRLVLLCASTTQCKCPMLENISDGKTTHSLAAPTVFQLSSVNMKTSICHVCNTPHHKQRRRPHNAQLAKPKLSACSKTRKLNNCHITFIHYHANLSLLSCHQALDRTSLPSRVHAPSSHKAISFVFLRSLNTSLSGQAHISYTICS